MSVLIKHILTRDSKIVERGFNETFFPGLSCLELLALLNESAVVLFHEVFNEVITRAVITRISRETRYNEGLTRGF